MKRRPPCRNIGGHVPAIAAPTVYSVAVGEFGEYNPTKAVSTSWLLR